MTALLARALEPLGLWLRLLGVSMRGQLQYRASFCFGVVGQFLVTGIEFLGVWALFDRFELLAGWRLAEVAVFYGVTNMALGLADSVSAGFDQLGSAIRQGDFDRVLLRPRSTVLQLVGQELSLRRLGRLLQGAVVLGWALHAVGVEWSLGHALLLLFTLAGGACLFLGLFVLQGTICFWTIETLEIMNTLTYGGVATAQYPLVIYTASLRRFFTFVVPLACVAYYPVVALVEAEDPLGSGRAFQVAAPALGFVFLLVSFGVWRLGLRRYASTGS